MQALRLANLAGDPPFAGLQQEGLEPEDPRLGAADFEGNHDGVVCAEVVDAGEEDEDGGGVGPQVDGRPRRLWPGCGGWRETRKGVKMAEPSPEWEGRKRLPEMERWVRD